MTVKKRRNSKKQFPKENVARAKFWWFCKVTIVSATLLSSFAVMAFFTIVRVNDFLNRPVEQITVKGELHYIKRQQLEMIIHQSAHKSFIKEHLSSIRKDIESSPWIDRVTLTRRWPSHLEVTIREQQPIARWGNQGFVNYRGELVKTDLLADIQHLPLLFGEEAEAMQLMQQYKTLTPLLLNNQLVIQSLSKNPLGIWQLELSNGWQLILGRSDMAEKVRLVSHVLDQKILMVNDAIHSIDMRYKNGFTIAWDDSVMIRDNELKNSAILGASS